MTLDRRRSRSALFAVWALVSQLTGCAGARAADATAATTAPAESATALPAPTRIRSRGGTLEVTLDPPPASVWRGETLELTASADYPADSRQQAAEAGTAALARAELGRLIRTTLVSSTLERSTTQSPATEITQLEVAVSRAVLPHIAIPTTGWARLATAEGEVLRIWARITISREGLRAAVRDAAVVAPDELDAVLERLEQPGAPLGPAR